MEVVFQGCCRCCMFCGKYIVFVLICFNFTTQREAEYSSKARSPAHMRTFKESEKSQKTVKSMIEIKGGDKGKDPGGKKNKNTKKEGEYCWTLPAGKTSQCLSAQLIHQTFCS